MSSKRVSNRSTHWRSAARILSLVLLLSGLGTACGEDVAARTLAGTVRSPVPNVGELSVPYATSTTGDDFFFVAPDDGLLVLYFGYTSCPDVCPTTMADLSAARTELGPAAERVSVAMLTIDPNRDTPEILDEYLAFFVGDGASLRTTDDKQLQAIATRFGATYGVEETSEGEIQVAHSGFLYAIDPDGNLQVSWAYGTPAHDISRDLEILLARQDSGDSTKASN